MQKSVTRFETDIIMLIYNFFCSNAIIKQVTLRQPSSNHHHYHSPSWFELSLLGHPASQASLFVRLIFAKHYSKLAIKPFGTTTWITHCIQYTWDFLSSVLSSACSRTLPSNTSSANGQLFIIFALLIFWTSL